MNEIYKLFVKQRIWIFVIILLTLRIASVCITGYDSHYMIDENEKYYHEYLQKYDGKITDDKQKEIEAEYEKINASGDELLASEQKNKAFQIIYNQYNYEKEKGSGYILDTRGWQSILEHDSLDFFLIVCIVIIMTALWGNEYETEMDIILRSCKKGKYRTPFMKVVSGVIISSILSVVFQMVQLIYLAGTVGLVHGDYPIQSLEFFQNTQYHISLSCAVLIIFAMRLVGAVLLALVVMLVNIWIKRKTVSMIVSMAVMVLPTIIAGSGAMVYYLPFPLGPLRAVGYLWPSQFESKYVGNELIKVCIFKGISSGSFIAMCILFFVEMILIGVLCITFFSKWKIKEINICKGIRMVAVFCLIVLSLFVTGCSGSNGNISVHIGKDDAQVNADWNGKKIEIDYGNNNIVYMNEKGEKEKLIRDVFPSELSIQKIFVHNNNCYYLSENDESSGVCIRKINLENFDNTLVYDSVDENIENYFGIIQERKRYDEIFDDFEETKWFFVTDNYIYWKKKYYIAQVDVKSGNKKIIAEGVSDDDITYSKGNLSYINAEGGKETYKCE